MRLKTAVLGVMLLSVSACSNSEASLDSLVFSQQNGGVTSAQQNGGVTSAESKMSADAMPYRFFKFTLTDQARRKGGEESVWKLAKSSKAEAERLASLLGEKAQVREETWMTWAVGGERAEKTYTTGGLSLYENGRYYWNNQSLWESAEIQKRYVSCATSGYNPDSPDTDVSDTVVCSEPYKVEIDATAATEKLKQIEPGVDWRVTYTGDWSVSFAGTVELGDRTTEDLWYAEVTDIGILSVSGVRGEITEVGKYPTISTEEAISRLENQGGYPVAMPYAKTQQQEPLFGSESTVVQSAPVEPTPAETIPVEPVPAETVPVEPIPQGDVEPVELTEIKIIEATESLSVATDVNGVTWIMPAWLFKDSNGGEWRVVSVTDEYYKTEKVSSGATDEPATTFVQGTSPGVSSPKDAGVSEFKPESVVGQTLREATEIIEAAGYEPRVTRQDDEVFIGTADYRTDRVNLETDKGVVTKASIG